MNDRTPTEPFIVWVDYGSHEGWSPWGFNTVAEAIAFIVSGDYGGPTVLTRRMELQATDTQESTHD